MEWLAENGYTLLVATALAGAVGLAIRSMLRRRKKSGSGCGGDCSRCSGCH